MLPRPFNLARQFLHSANAAVVFAWIAAQSSFAVVPVGTIAVRLELVTDELADNVSTPSGSVDQLTPVDMTPLGDGLAPGQYQVSIVALDRSKKYRDAMVPPSVIPSKYADISTSGLTCTIEAGKENELRFELD